MSAPDDRSRTILVPVDGSTAALAALDVAKTLAKIVQATVRIVHVAVVPPSTPQALVERLRLTEGRLDGTVLDVLEPEGDPSASVVRAAREGKSELIVMCTHTGELKPHPGLGSVALGVLREAPCPVVLVNPVRIKGRWALNDVLVPQDGAPTMAAALGPAMALAPRAGARLHILHVAPLEGDEAAHAWEPGYFPPPRYLDQPHHEWTGWCGEFLDRLRELAGIPEVAELSMHVKAGNPGREIVAFAAQHDVDLIVLAWRGSLAPNRARTLKDVVAGVSCPVLAFKV